MTVEQSVCRHCDEPIMLISEHPSWRTYETTNTALCPKRELGSLPHEPTTVPTPCTSLVPTNCQNPKHDHFGGRDSWENGHEEPWPHDDDLLRCNDCDVLTHYDRGDEWYHHDDPEAEPCFLVQS